MITNDALKRVTERRQRLRAVCFKRCIIKRKKSTQIASYKISSQMKKIILPNATWRYSDDGKTEDNSYKTNKPSIRKWNKHSILLEENGIRHGKIFYLACKDANDGCTYYEISKTKLLLSVILVPFSKFKLVTWNYCDRMKQSNRYTYISILRAGKEKWNKKQKLSKLKYVSKCESIGKSVSVAVNKYTRKRNARTWQGEKYSNRFISRTNWRSVAKEVEKGCEN